ncbi:LpqB family beta-propeller domain-containing protein [Cellulomonas wangsupingiae]|uniref:LpqB family beta-propeller domain-containing protein n=1 Tax=Cellulomonas wangsupingiae TaxID=2968085 RepID=A0ABY5K0W3_9CELL|nr:LpqB family beta-propeller domain-containing protein [Cellulomonas wangsupingiae]MCC2335647.1 LpqB family beta-propeller domain-containing protein [Cellulomonas wangsupingiae]UUI63884.1 LpqB family beta-propeller domain-containing protein [Cellulomonas wangsupingiae]
MSPRPTRRARLRASTVVLLVGAVLAGCVGIPTTGTVTRGDADEVREQDGVVVLAQGPQPDADPTGIVEGFLLAADAEVTGDFDVTRQFLAADERSQWDPGAGTVVASARKVEQTGDAQVTVSLSVTGKVDAEGRYLETAADALETLRYELVQDARGDWRIAHAPDVVVVNSRRFDQQFRPTTLYFLTPDHRMLVPEVRWFRDRNVPTAVVRALLAGPSPWLRHAVTTALPPDAELKPEAVLLQHGVAEVTLEPARAVQDADRGLLLAQLEHSLRSLGATKVQVRAGAAGAVLEEVAADLPAAAPEDLEILVDGQTLSLAGDTPTPRQGVGPVLGASPQGLARSADESVRVALADATTLVSVPSGGSGQRTLLEGPALAPPSVDRFSWVWTARASVPGYLAVVWTDGTTVELTADWLAGRTVRAVRVSRDGTRVAIVSAGPDGATLDVAGVVRDDEAVPVTIGAGVRAGASLTPTTSLVWVDDVTLGVLSDEEAGRTPYLVPVSGMSTPLPAVADAVGLAADRGERSVFVVTAGGDLLRHQGGTWVAVPQVTGVLDVAAATFPG